MKEVKYIDDMISKYTTNELVSFLYKDLSDTLRTLGNGIDSNNIGYIGMAYNDLEFNLRVMKKLNDKLNKKAPNVL